MEASSQARAIEVAAFRQHCRRLRFDPDDFVIEVQRSVPAPGGRSERIVTVHRHHHGRDFRAAAADGWVDAAALALRDGHFGKP